MIARDGTTLRRSGELVSSTRPVHVVSAWATAPRLILAQAAVATKDNKITTVPALLARCDLTNQIVAGAVIMCWRSRPTSRIC